VIDLDDERLADVLASVGEHLVIEPSAVNDGVRADRIRVRRPLVTVAIGLAAALVLVVVVAPIRRTVADWLGIGSTQIDVDPSAISAMSTNVTLPSLVDGVQLVDRPTAAGRLGRELPTFDGTILGAPSGFALMPEGGVLVVWSDGTTLWWRATVDETSVLLKKAIVERLAVTELDGLGDRAVLLVGEHPLRTPHRTVGAGNVVLWLRGDDELRLESDRDGPELVEIARALDAEVRAAG